jgi:glutathione synthase/RimK-type ligase-like ATP-grasp enzyme
MKKTRNFAATPFARAITPRARAAAPDKRVPLNILFGLPDDLRAHIKIVDDGHRLTYDLPGTADILPHLPRQRFACEVVYLHVGQKQGVKLRAGPLLNHIGDPDICSHALELAAQIVRKTGRPCFNHPDAIAATTRDRVARALTGIPGLDVPKTIRVAVPTPSEVLKAVGREGLRYPILVRVAGSHGGINMIKVDSPAVADEIDKLDRGMRQALYVTEFRDFVSRDGLYRKFRIVVLGTDIFLRQMVAAENWLIHGRRRAPNTRKEELDLFASFEDGHVERLRPLFHQIADRLDLDFFGVDCAIAESGEVLLFEANACMGILGQTQEEANVKAEAINRIGDAVAERLASPATWRHFRPKPSA